MMTKFEHGANVAEFARRIGVREDEIIDFSSNINFVKPCVKMPENLDFLYAYNSDGYTMLKAAIGKKYSVKPENIELYNGASVAILSLFTHLRPKSVTLHAPIYSEYKKAAAIVGAEIGTGGLSVWVNPSTPDGFLREITPHGQTIVDESFLDFTDGASLMGKVEDNKELYIVKSLTKYYGAAGARVGFVASHGENIAQLGASEPLWKLSSFDAYYMSEALKDGGFDGRSKAQNDANRELLRGALEGSGLFERVHDGKANFLLAKLKDINAESLQAHLAKYKILIRNCANFDTLDDSYVRFAVKDTQSIESLKDALCDL